MCFNFFLIKAKFMNLFLLYSFVFLLSLFALCEINLLPSIEFINLIYNFGRLKKFYISLTL